MWPRGGLDWFDRGAFGSHYHARGLLSHWLISALCSRIGCYPILCSLLHLLFLLSDWSQVKKSGHYFHIDFGHFLGNFKYVTTYAAMNSLGIS